MEKDQNPENWEWLRTSLYMPDGTWLTEDKTRKVDLIEVRRLNQHWHEKHHYLYINCYGVNQSCVAE